MKKKKIAFFVKDIFTLGGVQRVTTVIANALSLDYCIDIICFNSNGIIDRDIYGLNENIKIKFINNFYKKNIIEKIYSKIIRIINEKNNILSTSETFCEFIKEAYYWKSMRKLLINIINENKYDYIIGVEGELSIALATIKDNIDSYIIGWQHNSYEAYFETKNKYYWNQKNIFNKYMKKLDKYIVLTDDDKYKIKENFNIDSIRIYNPLSFRSDVKANVLNKNIISVGRLEKHQKGFDLLIESFVKIAKKNKDWTLSIVGSGNDKDEIQKIIDGSGFKDRIKIESFTSNMKERYLKSSIFVSASRWEGFGLVITEAMECGLAVISFDNTGPREIIKENMKYGILVEKYNVEIMAENIELLMNDIELRKNIIINSEERVENFSINKILDIWKGILS